MQAEQRCPGAREEATPSPFLKTRPVALPILHLLLTGAANAATTSAIDAFELTDLLPLIEIYVMPFSADNLLCGE